MDVGEAIVRIDVALDSRAERVLEKLKGNVVEMPRDVGEV